MVEILNSQLMRHADYSKLICRLRKMKVVEMQDTMLKDFNWNKTINMVRYLK